MVSYKELVVLIFFVPNVLSASFPLTAVSYYSSLAPCAQSHLTEELDSWIYDGCSSATPISAYGSCICAQRLGSIQKEISIDFEFDPECSSTSVQPFLTAFCNRWGVDIGADGAAVTTTTAAGAEPTAGGILFFFSLMMMGKSLHIPGRPATPGGTKSTEQPTPTSTSSSTSSSTSTSPIASPSGSSSKNNNDNKITIIASVVGSVAGVIAVVIAYLTLRHMRKGKDSGTQQGHGGTMSPPSHGYQTEMQHMQSPAQSHVYNEESYRQPFYGGQFGGGGSRY
ncbi:MAG: hypothetical protein Q9195_000729 [Heterodermia aff. obscurata]